VFLAITLPYSTLRASKPSVKMMISNTVHHAYSPSLHLIHSCLGIKTNAFSIFKSIKLNQQYLFMGQKFHETKDDEFTMRLLKWKINLH